MVGRVASVDRKTSGLFLGAKVAPAVDFTRLEEVFVILEQRQIPAEESFSAADEGLWPAAANAPRSKVADAPKVLPSDAPKPPARAAPKSAAGPPAVPKAAPADPPPMQEPVPAPAAPQ